MSISRCTGLSENEGYRDTQQKQTGFFDGENDYQSDKDMDFWLWLSGVSCPVYNSDVNNGKSD